MRNNDEGALASRHSRSISQPDRAPLDGRARTILIASALAAAALGGCASTESVMQGTTLSPKASAARDPMFPESKWGVSASRRVASHDERIPKGGGSYKVGEPYQVGGRWYNPRVQPDYDRVGVASWYGSDFHGRHTANGEVFDMHALTAAHPTLPLPSYVYVTNVSNNRTILVRVNDRGPYVGERMIDLSRESARSLGLLSGGTGRVRVRYAGPAPLDGDDRRERQFLASRPWTGGQDIAALEQAQSVRETYPVPAQSAAANRPRPVYWRPRDTASTSFAEEGPADRPMPSQGAGEGQRQNFADATPPPAALWSPSAYRASTARR